jgi:hypothetical protein
VVKNGKRPKGKKNKNTKGKCKKIMKFWEKSGNQPGINAIIALFSSRSWKRVWGGGFKYRVTT